jgi:hypothetical protein
MTRRKRFLACLLAVGAVIPNGPLQSRYITLQEADAMWLDQARNACASGSFSAFFQAFVRSQAVRNQHTAETVMRVIDGKRQAILRESYGGFPIALSDNTYVAPGDPPRGATPRYLRVRITDGDAGQRHVDWVRVLYDGNGNDRDGQARVRATIGPPGRLTFQPVGNCWHLSEDASGSGVTAPR